MFCGDANRRRLEGLLEQARLNIRDAGQVPVGSPPMPPRGDWLAFWNRLVAVRDATQEVLNRTRAWHLAGIQEEALLRESLAAIRAVGQRGRRSRARRSR
jgi:hypothetical protein